MARQRCPYAVGMIQLACQSFGRIASTKGILTHDQIERSALASTCIPQASHAHLCYPSAESAAQKIQSQLPTTTRRRAQVNPQRTHCRKMTLALCRPIPSTSVTSSFCDVCAAIFSSAAARLRACSQTRRNSEPVAMAAHFTAGDVVARVISQ